MTPNLTLKTWEESDLNLIMLEPLEVQTSTIDARVIKIEKFNRTVYAELGLLMLYFETKKLWHYVFDEAGERFKSFDSWVCNRCPYSRSYALEAKSKMKILKESGTPMDKLTEVTRANIQLLAQLPAQLQRDEEVLKDAQLLTEEAFRGKICREYPSAHIEEFKPMRFNPVASQRAQIEEALNIAMWALDTKDRNEALEYMAEYLLSGACEKEGFEGETNRAAYALWKGAGYGNRETAIVEPGDARSSSSAT